MFLYPPTYPVLGRWSWVMQRGGTLNTAYSFFWKNLNSSYTLFKTAPWHSKKGQGRGVGLFGEGQVHWVAKVGLDSDPLYNSDSRPSNLQILETPWTTKLPQAMPWHTQTEPTVTLRTCFLLGVEREEAPGSLKQGHLEGREKGGVLWGWELCIRHQKVLNKCLVTPWAPE